MLSGRYLYSTTVRPMANLLRAAETMTHRHSSFKNSLIGHKPINDEEKNTQQIICDTDDALQLRQKVMLDDYASIYYDAEYKSLIDSMPTNTEYQKIKMVLVVVLVALFRPLDLTIDMQQQIHRFKTDQDIISFICEHTDFMSYWTVPNECLANWCASIPFIRNKMGNTAEFFYLHDKITTNMDLHIYYLRTNFKCEKKIEEEYSKYNTDEERRFNEGQLAKVRSLFKYMKKLRSRKDNEFNDMWADLVAKTIIYFISTSFDGKPNDSIYNLLYLKSLMNRFISLASEMKRKHVPMIIKEALLRTINKYRFMGVNNRKAQDLGMNNEFLMKLNAIITKNYSMDEKAKIDEFRYWIDHFNE